MVICPKCGEKMEDEAFFCASCGALMKSNIPPEIKKRIEARKLRQNEEKEAAEQPKTATNAQPITKAAETQTPSAKVQPAVKPVEKSAAIQPAVQPAIKTPEAQTPPDEVQPAVQPVIRTTGRPEEKKEHHVKKPLETQQTPRNVNKPVPKPLSPGKSKETESEENRDEAKTTQKDRHGLIAGLIMVAIILVALIGGGLYYFMGSADEAELIGTYYPSSAKRGGEEMSPDSVLGEGFSVILQKDEEAVFNIPGSTTEGRWRVTRSGRFSFISSSMDIHGRLKNRLLTLELNGIELLMTWTADGTETAPESESETESESEKENRIPAESEKESESETGERSGTDLFEGDWYGVTLFSGCSGDYAGNDGLKAETIARLVFDEEGNCEPFIAMALGEKSKALNFRNLIMVWDAASDTMSLEGNCLKGDISGGTRVSISESGALGFVADIVENGSKVTLTVCMRRLDDDWKIDDVLSPNAETLEYYKGMNLETIAISFGVDISELPKQGFKNPDLSSGDDALTASYGG